MLKYLRNVFAVVLVLLGLAAVRAWAGPDFTQSAVEIVVGEGHGSGVYIGGGYVLTAAHVAAMTTDGTVHVKRPRSPEWTDDWSATVIWTDARRDFALVHIDATLPDDLPAAKVSCIKPAMGENVTIVGWPVDLGRVQSRGYIAGGAEKRGFWNSTYVMIAPIFFGNSGGPVFNGRGEVLALAVGIMQGTSLAIVIPTADVCKQLPAGFDK